MTYKLYLAILTLLISVVTNRYLGPHIRGEQAFIINVATWLSMVANLGLYQSYPYYKKNKIEDIKNRFANMVTLQFLFYLLISGLIIVGVGEFENYLFISILVVYPIMTFVKQLDFFSIVENIKIRNRVVLIKQYAYLIGVVMLYVFTEPELSLVIFVIIISQMVECFLLIVYLKLYKGYTKINFEKTLFIKFTKSGFFPMINIMLTNANYYIDILILKGRVSFSEIGYYTVGLALANMVWLIPDAFKEVLYSKSTNTKFTHEVPFVVKINLIIASIIIVVFWIMGGSVITILYGAEFIKSYNVTLIILVGTIPMVLFKLIRPIFLINGKDRISTVMLVASVFINIILNFAWIPRYGIQGAALASVVSYTVCGVAFVVMLKIQFQVNISEIFLVKMKDFNKVKRILLGRIESIK